MTIKPPAFKKNSVPSLRGWRHPRTGELLKKQKLTQEQIDEYLGHSTVEEVHEEVAPVVEEKPVFIQEVVELDNLSKSELEELGREHGVELDRRKKKSVLVETMKNLLG